MRTHTTLLMALPLSLALLATAEAKQPADNPAERATTIEELVPILGHTNAAARALAAEKLVALAPLPPTVVDPLRDMIWHEHTREAGLSACLALKAAGEDPGALLLDMLRSYVDQTPSWVATALKSFGTRELLEPALADPAPYVRLVVANAFLETDRVAAMATITSLYRDPDLEIRIRALQMTEEIAYEKRDPEAAQLAVPALLSLHDSEDPDTRAVALGTLAAIGSPLEVVTAAVVEGMRDPDPMVRREAIDAVMDLPALAPDTVRLMLSCFAELCDLADDAPGNPDLQDLTDYVDFSGAARPVPAELPALLAVLGPFATSDSRHEREMLACFLAGLAEVLADDEAAPTEAMLSMLTAGLDDPETVTRRWAAQGLAQFGPASAGAAGRLGELLRDPDDHTRNAAAYALGEMGPAATTAMPAVLAAAEDLDPKVRACTSRLLCDPDCRTPESVAVLARLVEDPETRLAVVSEVESLRDSTELAVIVAPALLAALGDPDARTRERAIYSVGALRLKEAIPILGEMLSKVPTDDQGVRIRSAAVGALRKIGDPSAIPYLKPLLASEEPRARQLALRALVPLGDRSERTIDAVIAVVQLPHERDLTEVCSWLIALGPAAERAVPALEALAEAKDEDERVAVASTLILLGHPSEWALRVVRAYFRPAKVDELLPPPQPRELDWSCLLPARALLSLGEAGPDVAHYLARCILHGPSPAASSRCEAVRLLAEIGCADDEVRDALRAAAATEYPYEGPVAEEARQALAKLGLTE